MTRCERCGFGPQVARGLCRPCYAYQQRTGKPRPSRLFARQPELNYRRWARGYAPAC